MRVAGAHGTPFATEGATGRSSPHPARGPFVAVSNKEMQIVKECSVQKATKRRLQTLSLGCTSRAVRVICPAALCPFA